MTLRLVATPDAVAALVGAMVTRFVVDDSLTVDLRRADGFAASVRIDGAIRYRGPAGAGDFETSVETGMAAVGPLFRHLFERVDRAGVGEDGCLGLGFGAAALEVPPHPHALAWRVATADGRQAACLEDGRVVVNHGVGTP